MPGRRPGLEAMRPGSRWGSRRAVHGTSDAQPRHPPGWRAPIAIPFAITSKISAGRHSGMAAPGHGPM